MKKLVLCSDGTGNSSAKAEKTNVWRMFQALDQTEPDQLVMYDDGVGTSSNKYLAILGGAFGYGLKRNVIDLYKFVCRKYAQGDEIHGFGFSRGAFTIRMVAALIEHQGLVEGRSESELHAHAVVAYRHYRNARYPSWSPVVWLGRHLRDGVLWFWTREAVRHLAELPSCRQAGQVPIRFLGLWDTVAAYGMPVDELKWGISLLIWPMAAIDHHLGEQVQRACHALSLDDQRETFHPILFDETHEARLVAAGKVPPGRLTQVWFAGVHSNVGGGYPEDQQSLVTLDWMMSQATIAGLRLDASAVQEVTQDKSPFARLYDSRRGLAAYYRYAPRQVDMGKDLDGGPLRATVHGSVVMRMKDGSDAYAPISLPATFDVLAPDGSLIPMEGFGDVAEDSAPRPLRAASMAAQDLVAMRTTVLRNAIADMDVPDAALVEQVRDTVWWRRVSYFACLVFTLLLVAFPFAAPIYAAIVVGAISRVNVILGGDAGSASAWLDTVLSGVISPWMGVLKAAAPSQAARWLDALARQPFEMLFAMLLVALPFFAGIVLAQHIHDRAWFAWHPKQRDGYVSWVRQSAQSSLITAMALLAAALALLMFALYAKWQYELIGLAGLVAVALALVTIWRIRISLRLRHLAGNVLPTTPTLRFARWLRVSTTVAAADDFIAHIVIPLAFALALLWGIVGGANHLFARALDSGGVFCTPTPSLQTLPSPSNVPMFVTASGKFDLKSMCWATGIAVTKGRNYEVVLDASQDRWRDRGTPASVAGIAKPSSIYTFALPIRRSWDFDWFVPVLRIGPRGNDERAISHVDPTGSGAGVARQTFKATSDGEVFIYVNDAVDVVPFAMHYFYDNNDGTASLQLREVCEPK